MQGSGLAGLVMSHAGAHVVHDIPEHDAGARAAAPRRRQARVVRCLELARPAHSLSALHDPGYARHLYPAEVCVGMSLITATVAKVCTLLKHRS